MSLELSERLRFEARRNLDDGKKRFLGQYFTPAPICNFMASMMTYEGKMQLLDPGCGVASLSSSVIERALKEGCCSVNADLFDIDYDLSPYVEQVLSSYKKNKKVRTSFYLKDFILSKALNVKSGKLHGRGYKRYTHVISNPPYKKLSPSSEKGSSLVNAGLEYYNLYSAFVSLSIALLKNGGELVCIIPRSFCNGPFYKGFRQQIVNSGSIKRIHIFESRTNAFSVDRVLQENVILHFVKGINQGDVTISSSAGGDFVEVLDGKFTATDYTERVVSFDEIVNPADKDLYIHIAKNESDQECIRKIESLPASIDDLGVKVSTGPVVDFRVKEHLHHQEVEAAVPLFFPIHLNGKVNWPKDSKKPNFISLTDSTKNITWENRGAYLLVRRFSSKEEKRRLTGTFYDSNLPYPKVGFDNKVNVFHSGRIGLDPVVARGLYVYINSTIIDRYFRCFSGHTQINASDLRKISYPSLERLSAMGAVIDPINCSQEMIDEVLEHYIPDLKVNV